MATATKQPRGKPSSKVETVADLVEQLGGIPLERIRLQPAPGTATEYDVIAALEAPRKRHCELVDGVLVEKGMGTKEALLAGYILTLIWNFLDEHDLGIALAGDGAVRLKLGLIRIPDVSFIPWNRMPGGELPDEAIASVIPELAVEVLSESNTPKEIDRKLREYFRAGVRLAWVVERDTQTVKVYTSPTKFVLFVKDQSLDGRDVLPGFSLPLKKLFAKLKPRRKER